MNDDQSIGPTDGSAAHLLEGATCAWLGCENPPVTHRHMTVRLPIRGNHGTTIDSAEQEVDAAFCKPHDEMIAAGQGVFEPKPGYSTKRAEDIKFHETSGGL